MWDYEKGTIDLSMPRYIEAALYRFVHPLQNKLQHAPSKLSLVYGKMAQQAVPDDYSEQLNEKETTAIQQLVGTLFFLCACN